MNFSLSEPLNIVASADGRALLSYHRYPTIGPFLRIVDFNANGGRARPTRP